MAFVKHRQSISRRFSIAMIVVVTVIVSGFACVLIVQRIHSYESELQERLSIASKLAEMSLPTPLWYYNHAFLEDFLQALLLDSRIVCANILVDDEIVAGKIQADIPQEEWAFFEQSPDFMTQITDIMHEGKTIGVIQLVASRASIQQEIRMSIASTVILALLLILAIAFTSILVTRRYIVRPLANMVDIARMISHGELDVHVGQISGITTFQDELGQLAGVFHYMVGYLQNMATMATQISMGDMGQDVMPQTEKDVLGSAFQRMITYLQHIAHVAAQISQGDLRSHVDVRSSKDRIGRSFNHMTQGLSRLISNIRTSSNETSAISARIRNTASKNTAALDLIGTSAQKTSAAMQHVNAGSEDIRVTTESLNAAVEETRTFLNHMISSMTVVAGNSRDLTQFAEESANTMVAIVESLETISTQAEHSKVLAETTAHDALSGQESVGQVITSMSTISDMTENLSAIILRLKNHSLEINTILDVITDVAEQTSLLALNASILAAQAGTQGRGFAVVAAEIKELATRVGTSTKKIAAIVKAVQRDSVDAVNAIQAGQHEVKNGVAVAQKAGDALHKIGQSAGNSAEIAAEIATLVGQQVITHTGITTSIRDVTTMIAQITASIREQENQTSQLSAVVDNMQALEAHVLNATREQQHDTHEVMELMEGVISLVEENTRTVQELAASAHELAAQASTLKAHVERFTIPGHVTLQSISNTP